MTVSWHVVVALYQEFRPDRRLAPLVECGWVRSGSATRSLRVMPDGCVDLFVSSQGDVMLAGPATTFYDLRPDNGCVLAGLRLRPGAAAAVVGRPVSDFTEHRVHVDSIFGVHGCLMAEKVLAATTPSQRVMALTGGPLPPVTSMSMGTHARRAATPSQGTTSVPGSRLNAATTPKASSPQSDGGGFSY
jgi:hypothetical protein